MECNKDDALRAKEIAEKKFMDKDIIGAKKFAIKARNLFPALEGIGQMIATLDVHIAAEARVSGEKDWYAILSVSTSADDETVRKQYRKLALQLHPDKNKSIGAEGAFQLILDAWNVLSDSSKRMTYDQKRNIRFQQKSSQSKRQRASASSSNGFYTFAKSAASTARAERHAAATSSATVPVPPCPTVSNTFWTSCNQCKMQYEYVRMYLNRNLLCPNCHEPFLATEIAGPTMGTNPPRQTLKQNSTNKSEFDSRNKVNFHWGPFSRAAGAASATASSAAAAQAANLVHQTYEKVRREREKAQATARREEALRRKYSSFKRGTNVSESPNQRRCDDTEEMASGSEKTSSGNVSGIKVPTAMGVSNPEGLRKVSGDFWKSKMNARQLYLSRAFLQLDIRGMLIEKTKLVLQRKLEDWSTGTIHGEENKKARKKPKLKEEHVGKNAKHANHGNDDQKSDQKPISNDEENDHVSIDVPDPDFHDFDKDRTEDSFQNEQIWAIYDDKDGMPRFYVFIQQILSLTPFKIRISFLSSNSNSEFGPLNWVSTSFTKTCGDFRIGRYETHETINIFSHRVKWEKGPHGTVRLYPKKGNVWALYQHWSPEWNESTPNDVIYKYDMVEVLDDYDEDRGISVALLMKVAGFKAVFKRHLDLKEVKRIPKEEMFRFSHQVPSYELTGVEAPNAPKGCYELDTAATPLELLQVVPESKQKSVAFKAV